MSFFNKIPRSSQAHAQANTKISRKAKLIEITEPIYKVRPIGQGID